MYALPITSILSDAFLLATSEFKALDSPVNPYTIGSVLLKASFRRANIMSVHKRDSSASLKPIIVVVFYNARLFELLISVCFLICLSRISCTTFELYNSWYIVLTLVYRLPTSGGLRELDS